MNLETKLLNRLKAEQQQYAVEALGRPQQRDAFEYGLRVGTFAGYEAAINVLIKIIDEETHAGNEI